MFRRNPQIDALKEAIHKKLTSDASILESVDELAREGSLGTLNSDARLERGVGAYAQALFEEHGAGASQILEGLDPSVVAAEVVKKMNAKRSFWTGK